MNELSPEASKVLELIEQAPYQGAGTFHLACDFRDWKGYGHETPGYEELVWPYIDELKEARLIYRSACTRYSAMWVAERHRALNEDLDSFISDGRARSVLMDLRIKTVEELTTFKAQDLLRRRHCGKRTLRLIIEALEERGLSLAEGLPERRRICPHCGKDITARVERPSLKREVA